MNPLETLRHHVTGAIERGETQPIVEVKPMKYRYVNDPGHGWVGVPKSELNRLGIADQISTYSYVEGETVWLEEDCDLTRWVNCHGVTDSKTWRAFSEAHIVSEYVNATHIRDLPSYRPS